MRSGLAKRLIEAAEALFVKKDAEAALLPLSAAIDCVAQNIYGRAGRAAYKNFIHERMELITRVAFNGMGIFNLNLAIDPIYDERGKVIEPDVQVLINPALNPDADVVGVFGLRARLVF